MLPGLVNLKEKMVENTSLKSENQKEVRQLDKHGSACSGLHNFFSIFTLKRCVFHYFTPHIFRDWQQKVGEKKVLTIVFEILR